MDKYEKRFEYAHPRDIEIALKQSPVAYIPIGSLEFHGWHLPLGFDSIKAHALCMLACEKTGGMVLPPSFFGFAGGHLTYDGTIMSEEKHVRANLEITLTRLYEMGFKVAVVLTGHYPVEQVDLVHDVSEKVSELYPGFKVIGFTEPETFDEWCGDHAAKWETSIALTLMPDAVKFNYMEDNEDPLFGICGDDPREYASSELGKWTVDTIIHWICKKVNKAKENS